MNSRLKILVTLVSFLTLLWFYARGQASVFLIAVILLISSIYTVGLIRLWRNAGVGHGLSLWRAASFLSAMIILICTLTGPLDELADKAFSMHMIQHMLLMKVVAPLLLLGEFSSILLWAIGQESAHRLGKAWKRSRLLQTFWKKLTYPWVAWAFFALCLWLWHVPAFYQAALQNEFLHDVEHVLFLSTSLLFWWYLLQSGRDSSVRYGGAVLFLFTTLLHESALGALLTFSSRNWYAWYVSPDAWGLSSLADQQLAGMIMWLPGGILFMLLIVYYFGSWLQAIEKRMPIRQAELVQTGDRNE